MHPTKRLSIKSATVAGIAASAVLGLAGLTLNPAPAEAVVYCSYVGYPAHCVARAGVVLRPRPVARLRYAVITPGNLWRDRRRAVLLGECEPGRLVVPRPW